MDAKLEEVDHWIKSTLFDVGVFAEIIVCIE